jgi:hypothetical protein
VLEGSVLPSGNQVRVNAQLIDADNGAHLWADQFDTPRADLLQTQDEIVTRLARLKQTPAANPDAEDLALQCVTAIQKAGNIGKDADAGSRLCEQALAADPSNVRAPTWLAVKIYYSVNLGLSANPKAELERGDKLVSRALALDPNYARAHSLKGVYSFSRGASTNRSRSSNARFPWTPPW